MNPRIILCLALVLGGVLFGRSDTARHVGTGNVTVAEPAQADPLGPITTLLRSLYSGLTIPPDIHARLVP